MSTIKALAAVSTLFALALITPTEAACVSERPGDYCAQVNGGSISPLTSGPAIKFFTVEEWNAYQAEIIQYYIDRNKPVPANLPEPYPYRRG